MLAALVIWGFSICGFYYSRTREQGKTVGNEKKNSAKNDVFGIRRFQILQEYNPTNGEGNLYKINSLKLGYKGSGRSNNTCRYLPLWVEGGEPSGFFFSFLSSDFSAYIRSHVKEQNKALKDTFVLIHFKALWGLKHFNSKKNHMGGSAAMC